jgi:hypothetical protein
MSNNKPAVSADVSALLVSVAGSNDDTMKKVLPHAAAAKVAGQQREEEMERKKEEARKKILVELSKEKCPAHLIGQLIEGQGIFLGRGRMRDSENRPLNQEFNLFAAPQPLTDKTGRITSLSYGYTIAQLDALEDWHGHDGKGYANYQELREAMNSGMYRGEWVMPARHMISGLDALANRIQTDTFLKHIDKGDLKEAFNKATGDESLYYWSCTERADAWSRAWCLRLPDGALSDADLDKEISRNACWPVRMTPVPRGRRS